MRFLFSIAFALSSSVALAISDATPAPTALPSRVVSPVAPSRPGLSLPTDTVPPLTRAELRELRRLERADARARLRRGDPGAYDGFYAAGGGNGFAVASLPAGLAGLLALFTSFTVWNPGVLIVVSILAFVAALVFGAIGLRRARWEGRRFRGLAIAGFVIGLVGTGFFAVVLTALLSGTW